MGYDVHITRAEHWADNEEYEILPEEWLTIVRNDPELIPVSENGPYFVVWRGTRKYRETWFNWQAGNIETKNPDKPTLQKMLQIAITLKAQVQGDDGEIYDDEAVESFDDSFLDKKSSLLQKLFKWKW